MSLVFRFAFGRGSRSKPWDDLSPVREELFGVERLEQHARSLAAAQTVTAQPPIVLPLRARLEDNAAVLFAAYRASAAELASGRSLVSAAQWLLDGYHLVAEHIREIRNDLPPGYYRQLPKLAEGPFAGYPRVFGIAWAFVAHTDSYFDPAILRRFVVAYQQIQPLTIGELWAIAITLRIVLIENLRRLTDEITAARACRAESDALANRLLAAGDAQSALDADIATRSTGPLSEIFAAQLAKRMRDQDPRSTPALGWLEERLKGQGASIDEAVQHAQQREGASNVTVRNVVNSLRLISDIDWAELFESVSLVDERLRRDSAFAAMDFPTRNLYRSAIEQLARGSASTELEVAERALDASQRAPAAVSAVDATEAQRVGDPGYHLIGKGRPAFERTIQFRANSRLRINRFGIRLGIGGYVGSILAVTALLLALTLWALASGGLRVGWLGLVALIGLLPASEVATALVNRAIARAFGPVTLPGLELEGGVPQSLRTLVAVPTLLTGDASLLSQIERLEVHHLSGAGGDISYALLTDGVDADQEALERDVPLLATACEAIRKLNNRYGPGPAGDRFFFLHRRRLFNAGENKWMGWERKRGKLHELNRLLRGATDTTFMSIGDQPPRVPADVRYVITLDSDTMLPRDAALRLIGKMAHPLNRPRFDSAEQRVLDGYAILQPRVTPSLPFGRDGSLFHRIFSGPSGIDPYASAVSNVYQDLFAEGSYTGKGIYDVDAFEAALSGRVPDNALLSHDLFEGVFARAGLATDVEFVDEFPSRYDVAAKRNHRWARGDWQLLPWIFRRDAVGRLMPALGRGKMLDNLRRSLLAPLTLASLVLCCVLPAPARMFGVAVVLASLAIPLFFPIVFSVIPRNREVRLRNHFGALGDDLRSASIRTFLSLAFLADQAWSAGDAIARTLERLFATHHHLLEWTTAAQSSEAPRLDVIGFYRSMAGGVALGLFLAAGLLAIAPASWRVILPLVLLWLAAPALALWISRPPNAERGLAASESELRDLRLTARRTWRYFETFVTAADAMLPPDNFQEDPKPVVAHRTSPTNIGLYLLSTVAARDFGWAGMLETVERLEAAFISLRKLRRFKGHFFNWYDTRDLRVLDPVYVSSVDSGNLAGYLIALANACEEWMEAAPVSDVRPGAADNLALAREALGALSMGSDERDRHLSAILDQAEAQLKPARATATQLPTLKRLAEKAAQTVRALMPVVEDEGVPDVVFWIDALAKVVAEHTRDLLLDGDETTILRNRLYTLAKTAREMAMAMDFAFLLDPERKLLSLGCAVGSNRLDPSCYDLLASEARLASLFAVAKGDVATGHWFRLGRTTTPAGSGSALISWSGSMFEYLMPSLVMRAPLGSLLEQTNRLIVERQMTYASGRGVPWGISESAYNARDLEFTYQYSNFGVPGLGIKRGLSKDLVIAPYATGLAAMVDPSAARRNYARLARLGASGRYGFYEAIDFTRSRLPDDKDFSIIQNFMAHHQGMTIVAIANVLHDGHMRARFRREPMIKASELLLQERAPREVVVAQTQPDAAEVSTASAERVEARAVREITDSTAGGPISHLLSNGRYAVMLTAAGAGYSRWRDIAITRWREDATRDDWGSFIFLKDTRSGSVWSASLLPIRGDTDHGEVIFAEDRAEFTRHNGGLTSTMDVLVSGEDDSEVRRLSVTNAGRRPREIEITSYAELVLTTPETDDAHPAFAKMFVVTEHLPEYDALVATRRRRSPAELTVWAAHFAVVEGEIVAEPQFESDRARFLGRSRALRDAAAIVDGTPLSGTVGTVLDPIFSLRSRVTIASGRAARIAFWTVVASSRAELLRLIDRHHDRSAFDRAKTLAWTQARVQLRHLDITAEEAADFQRLAAPILYADRRFRAPSEGIVRGADSQVRLWPHGISGDLPIVLLRIDDSEDMAQVRQLLRAHEYWRMKGLSVDLVIVNESASSYKQDLQIAIETAARSSDSRPRLREDTARGSVYALRADLMSLEVRALLQSIARVALIARRGHIADQLAQIPPPAVRTLPRRAPISVPPLPPPARAPRKLEFFNGLGGFAKSGTEYVVVLGDGETTPAPWINIVANPHFGFQTSAEGSGYTWAGNSKENQLTPWSNDPVVDTTGEAIYVRDEASGELWCPTAQPIRDGGTYVARHGFGYSRFEHEANGIALELLQYVPLTDPIKISGLTLRNVSAVPRRLLVTAYAEWTLGHARGACAPFVTTEIDGPTGAMFARNRWNIAYSDRVAFADLAGRQTAWTADRTEFLGRDGRPEAPAALTGTASLSGATGAGFDPCVALQRVVDLGVAETTEVVVFFGQCTSVEEARSLIARYRKADLDAVLGDVTDYWAKLLGAVQVRTPDRAMDIMLNGWLLYQTLACRIWARSAFYQASGAYGFRDQLQDGMALTFAQPETTRRHLLRAAARQFVEGDVQHWWVPHSGQGVRTRISDDRVWLAYATATYAATSGDLTVLDERVSFLEGPNLAPGQHDAFFQPMIADESASLFEHCARGLDQCLELTSERGLPLIGTGDWNDGMNRVGEGGKGESVWLGWFLVRTIELFLPFARSRDPERAKQWIAHAASVRAAIEREAWDGDWYRRATFDDGTWLGSQEGEECRVDSIAQSWAVLSGAADPARAAAAMASLDKRLIRADDGLTLLFWPPFDKSPLEPGYVKGYPPGLRENGGQYSHAAMWTILAFSKLGDGARAHDLFAMLNPINHALTAADIERYKVEPYVVAADIYSVSPHVGRGGWSWYTGSAAWMYRAGVEGILGIRRERALLVIDPCLPDTWPGFDATVKIGSTRYNIQVENSSPGGGAAPQAILDGDAIALEDGRVRVPLDGGTHTLTIAISRSMRSGVGMHDRAVTD
jgi:cyclic beta-1,2-glucan synthetase